MKKLLLFFIVLFSCFPVLAASINTDSYSQANSFNNSSRYDYSTDNYLGDSTNFSVGTLGTRYNGKSYYFQFNFHHTITALKVYDLRFTSDTYDFTNQIVSDRFTPLCYQSFSSSFNEKECADISIVYVKRGTTSNGNAKEFTIRFMSTNSYTYWGFKIAGGFYNLTGVNNFKISNIFLDEVDTSGSNDIINNANQNTQEIINNSTSNTNNIIDNANQNTQDIINNANQNTESTNNLLGNCYTNLLNINSYRFSGNVSNVTLNTNSIEFTSNNYGVVYWDFTDLKANTNYTISYNGISQYLDKPYFEMRYSLDFGQTFYTTYGQGIQTHTFNTGNHTNLRIAFLGSFDSTNNTVYLENITLTETDHSVPYSPYNEQICTSKLDSLNYSIDNMNDYMQDNSDPYVSDNEFLAVINNIGFNDPLSNLLQLPINFINQLVLQSNSCQVVNLGTLWGVSISLPCIDIGSIIGQNLWDTIDILASIGLVVSILKSVYESIANALTLGGYMEAKRHFGFPTPLTFLAMILGGEPNI